MTANSKLKNTVGYILAIIMLGIGGYFIYETVVENRIPPLKSISSQFFDYSFSYNSDGSGTYYVRYKERGGDDFIGNGAHPLRWKKEFGHYKIVLSAGIFLDGRESSHLYISRDKYLYLDYVDMDEKRTWNGYKIP